MDSNSSIIPSVVINLIALSHSSDLVIGLEGQGIGFYNDLMLIFAIKVDEKQGKIVCDSLNQNTQELRGKITSFIEKYKSINPRINKLGDYFKKLEEGERFFVIPSTCSLPFDVYEKLFNYLVSLRDGIPYEAVIEQTSSLFGDLRELYDMKAYGNIPVSIGEPDKTKRVCRFCGKDASKTTFKTKAHTISKSLGNNLIVTNDECDICNNNFGKNVESDFAEYVGVFRSIMGMRGYNGIPHIKGDNFDIKQEDGQVKLNFIASTEEEEKMPVENMHLPLNSKQKIRLQNVYRSIVKYALSVLDASEMSHFTDTIEWIFQKMRIDKLPKVAMLEVPSFYNQQPQIIVYRRKNDDKRLPYLVVEFHFAHLVFVAIVPKTDMDAIDFMNENEYQYFWKTFKHFSSNTGWQFKDFSSDIDDTFITNLNIVQRTK